MFEIIKIAFFISLIATLSVLVFGLITYFYGGILSQQYSNKAMRWRILFQGITLLLFLCLLLMR